MLWLLLYYLAQIQEKKRSKRKRRENWMGRCLCTGMTVCSATSAGGMETFRYFKLIIMSCLFFYAG